MTRKILCFFTLLMLMFSVPGINFAFASTQDDPTTVIVDNYHLGFTGTWGHMNNLDKLGIMGYYLETASSTTEDNTSFDYTFTDCTQIFWYANYNPVYVKVDIYLDGELHCTLVWYEASAMLLTMSSTAQNSLTVNSRFILLTNLRKKNTGRETRPA